MKKVVIYIDGSNFYFSVKNKFDSKLNIEKFCQKLVRNKEFALRLETTDDIGVQYYGAEIHMGKSI